MDTRRKFLKKLFGISAGALAAGIVGKEILTHEEPEIKELVFKQGDGEWQPINDIRMYPNPDPPMTAREYKYGVTEMNERVLKMIDEMVINKLNEKTIT